MTLTLLKVDSQGSVHTAGETHFTKGELEKCILCHDITDVPCSTPIEERGESYIQGAGQLCGVCNNANKEQDYRYLTNHADNIFTLYKVGGCRLVLQEFFAGF